MSTLTTPLKNIESKNTYKFRNTSTSNETCISGRDNATIFGYDVSSATVISLLVIFLVLTVVVFILVSNLCRLHLYLLWHGWTTWDYYRRPKDERAQHSYWKYNVRFDSNCSILL